MKDADDEDSDVFEIVIGNAALRNKSLVVRKRVLFFFTWSDTNQAVQLQKMAKGLKFWIKKLEGLYYICSGNKDSDQLRGYREADLRLCFRICKTLISSRSGSNIHFF